MIEDDYNQRVAQGALKPDAGQAAAVQVLADLQEALGAHGRVGMLAHILKAPTPPKGVYLWGAVGRGKSMLMDMFFDSAPVALKRRVHFHAFMAEIQDRLETWRHAPEAKAENLIVGVASEIAAKSDLLCFDELEVVDIADAMILGRLFEALFERGIVLVATSNEAPEDLYRDGINRQLFDPFIDLIKAHTQVVHLDDGRDYRTGRSRGVTYFCPLDNGAAAGFDAAWRDAIRSDTEAPQALQVHGRRVGFSRTAGEALRSTFAELCERELGAEDYLALAAQFAIVFIEGVPVLNEDRTDPARRFVLLVDALYEAKTKVVLLAAADPDRLFQSRDEASLRAASRLNEMRSADYRAEGPSASSRRATDVDAASTAREAQ